MDDKTRTNEQVDRFIPKLPDDIKNLTIALRKLIFKASPKLTEEFKWSMPNYSYNGLVCYLQPAKKHVNLGFNKGNELLDKDTHNLLLGTGKTMRHIKISKMEEIQPEVFTKLIQEAIALNEK